MRFITAMAVPVLLASPGAFGQTPTPTPSATPTATGTPTPVFDLDVSDVALTTGAIVDTVPSTLFLTGSFAVAVQSPGDLVNTDFGFTLMDAGLSTTYFADTVTYTPAEILLGVINYSIPVDPGLELPLQQYVMRVEADPGDTYGELDRTNNVADSNPQTIARSTGLVLYDDIETTITTLTSLSGSPLILNGVGLLNDISITYTGLEVITDATGNLVVTSGMTTFDPGGPVESSAGFLYTVTNGELNPSGAFANVRLLLPDELSYRTDAFSTFIFTDTPIGLGLGLELDQDLAPRAPVILTESREFHWEGLPLIFSSAGQTFTDDGGLELTGSPSVRYYHSKRFLEATGPGPRAANDAYFHAFAGDLFPAGPVFITADGINASLSQVAGSYRPSFPLDFDVSFASATYEIADSRIVPGSSELSTVSLNMGHDAAHCGGDNSVNSQAFSVGAAAIMTDGAVVIDEVTALQTYEFNTYVLEDIDVCRFYQPGYMVREDMPADRADGVDEYLLVPWDPDTGGIFYYGSQEFHAGSGYYAGINFSRTDLDGAAAGVSIDSDPGNPLALILNNGSKLYARRSGFSGIVDAGAVSEALQIYPESVKCTPQAYYKIDLTSFGQAMLSNDPTGWDNKIDGLIDIPFPSAIQIPFEDMLLNGCGNFEGGKIPDDAQTEEKILAHWLATVKLQTLSFDLKTPTSSDDERTLWVSAVAPVPNLTEDVQMQINLLPCGDIGDSRIAEPVYANLDGYPMSVNEVYFSRFDPGRTTGFYNIAGQIHFPYFGASDVHAIVRAGIVLMADGRPYFDEGDADPDDDDDGFPDGFVPTEPDPDDQVDEYVAQELVHVSQVFANRIDLIYDLAYNSGLHEFSSPETVAQDIIVINAESSVTYLNPERVEIEFGLEFGLPDLSLSSLASEFATDSIDNLFLSPIRDNLEAAGERLNGDLTQFIRDPMRQHLTPLVAQALELIQDDVAAADPKSEADLKAVLQASVNANLPDLVNNLQLVNYLRGQDNPVHDELGNVIDRLNVVSGALNFDIGELGELATGVAELANEVLSLVGGFNLDDVLGPLADVRDRIVEILDDEIIPAFQDAQNALSFENIRDQIFDAAQITGVEAQVELQLDPFLKNLNLAQVQNLDPDEVTNYILNQAFNSPMYSQLNSLTMVELYPVKAQMENLSQQVLDGINNQIEEYIEESGAFQSETLEKFNDILNAAGGRLDGYAIISGEVLEKLHIDLSVELNVPDEFGFQAYLDITRYQVSALGENCTALLDGSDFIDARIGANDVDLSFRGEEGLKLSKVELQFMIAEGQVVNVGGEVATKGGMSFEAASFSDLGLGVGIGQVENYLWATGAAKFSGGDLAAGVFFGSSCDLDPLLRIDPDVAEFIDTNEMFGFYVGADGQFPIYDIGCLLRFGVAAKVGLWYFANVPTYGGELVGGAYGEAGCVVSVRGQIDIFGAKKQSQYVFEGDAWVAGGFGFCEPEDWDSPSDVWDDKWCYTCVAFVGLEYDGNWDVGYNLDCE